MNRLGLPFRPRGFLSVAAAGDGTWSIVSRVHFEDGIEVGTVAEGFPSKADADASALAASRFLCLPYMPAAERRGRHA